jgi:hypothetical protein
MIHELGHTMHFAARVSEGLTQTSQVDRAIMDIAGGKKWSANATDQISGTAGTDLSELVAESVSEVLYSPNPSLLAQNVYDVLSDRLANYMRFRTIPV